MFTCFCFDIVQLAYVYCVGFSFTCFYIGNLLVICIHTTAGDICLVAITNASIRHIELSCFYAVYIQVFLQCQACCCNLKIIFACLEIYCNCIVFSANSNAIAFCIGGVFCIYSVDILSISSCSFIYRNDIGTCFYLCLSCCTYLIQLAYVYCIGVGSTCCYTSNLASIINGNLVVKLDSAICKANAACACTGDGFNTSQSGVQCQTVAVNYEVLFAIFQLNFNLLLGDRNTIACSQSYACYLLIYVLYVGYRMIVSFINVGYVCIVGGHAV